MIGGNPSVEWSNLAAGQHTWLWQYPTPVPNTRDNFAASRPGRGGATVPIALHTTGQGPGRDRAGDRPQTVKLRLNPALPAPGLR